MGLMADYVMRNFGDCVNVLAYFVLIPWLLVHHRLESQTQRPADHFHYNGSGANYLPAKSHITCTLRNPPSSFD